MKEVKFIYLKKADKFFKKHSDIKNKFVSNMLSYVSGNSNLDIKAMKTYKGMFRMRIGDYRVLYRLENGQIVIVTVVDANTR